jgi:hypothetical protein
VDFKSLKELDQDLVFGTFSLDHVRVSICLIETFNILKVDNATIIPIQHGESLVYELRTCFVHFTANCHQELIKVQSSVVVPVEGIENCGQVLFRDPDSEVTARSCELKEIQGLAFVIVHDLEHPLKADHSASASRFYLIAEKSHHLIELFSVPWALDRLLPHLKRFTVGSRLDNLRELLVIDLTITGLIIKIKDLLDILFLVVWHDNSKFLDCSFELVQGDTTLVCNIKEFECFGQKRVFLRCGGTFLFKFSHKVILKSTKC